MFEFINGRLIEKNPAYVVVDCNGIGYLIHISLNTYSKIADNEPCKLFVHLSIREDAWVLFGFFDQDERRLFRLLISVSGVGPSTAQLVLSSLSPSKVVDAILSGNVALLQSVKGIGAKTAQRVMVDLKDKVDKIDIVKDTGTITISSSKQEALAALVMLGFMKPLAEKALDKIIQQHGDALNVEDLIKKALQNL